MNGDMTDSNEIMTGFAVALAPTSKCILISLSLCFFLTTYVWFCRHLKRRSWLDLIAKYCEKQQLHHGKHFRFQDIMKGLKTGTDKFSTATEQYYERLYYQTTFGAVYLVTLIKAVCLRLPPYLGRMAWSKYMHGHYASHTEQDVVDAVLSCPSSYMLCKAVDKEVVSSIYDAHNKNNDVSSNDLLLTYLNGTSADFDNDQVWMYELPEELPGEPHFGSLEIRHLTILFLQRRRRILFASHLGVPLDLNAASNNSTNLNTLFTLVASSIITWSHVQIHVMAEMSAEQIARGRLNALEPSARFVDSLHEGLLNSPISPIVEGHIFSAISVSRDTLERRLLHRAPHYLDARKNELPAYSFLLSARALIACRLKQHGLSKFVTTEFLFQNMVVHSIDHYFAYKFFGPFPHSIDGSETFRSYLESFVVYAFWTKSKVNPLDDHRLSAIGSKTSLSHDFYKEVYEDLKKIDPYLTDKIIVSCSY